MENPELALIPSAQGTKFYSVLPSSGVGDFEFTRSGSATRINSQGLIETVANGVSRLNYTLIDGVVNSCPSHLLEPERINLISYSEDFSNSLWVKSGGSTTEIADVISPKGDLTATKLIRGVTLLSLRHNNIATFNSVFTFSCYAKKGSKDKIRLDIADQGGTTFDLTDDWQRFEITVNNQTNDRWVDITLPNCISNDYIYIYGAQVEEGDYSTSYIPTSGSSATRSAETANDSGNSEVFNDSEGVLFAEIKAFEEVPSISMYIGIESSLNSFVNSVILQYRDNGQARVYVNGTGSSNIQFIANDIDFTKNNKIAIQYDSIGSNYKMFVNGVSISRYSLAVNQSITGLSKLNLSFNNSGIFGEIKDVRFYNTALTDQELQALTTI